MIQRLVFGKSMKKIVLKTSLEVGKLCIFKNLKILLLVTLSVNKSMDMPSCNAAYF